MQSALDQFKISIGRVRDLIALYNSLQAQSTQILDLSDLLRASLVLAVSALDYYIHEVVTLGMLEIYRGQRPEPNPSRNQSQSSFSRFKVSLGNARQERSMALGITSWLEDQIRQNYGDTFLQSSHNISSLIPVLSTLINNKLNDISWLEDEIRVYLGYKSFQHPDKISEAIRLISGKELWNEISQRVARSPRDIKQNLASIVDRRNKIAHEADIDPTYNIGDRWPINPNSVISSVDFIENIVENIHVIL
ncbi:HEPN domain-containing protein [Oxynema aestuarii]|uniref:RiboL-PSP-HEPN domain-containing protein n=1 Tax=Oxynema aestuarii AP17 TaxID=2064643 RepID=A0A6H1TW01_9CYAN|nr:HEPN domain-containing protein [Oxynema aestuarii]QIZ70751.1 hypothetical protein HCG48_09285 [Oxynema aestuarii AP17]